VQPARLFVLQGPDLLLESGDRRQAVIPSAFEFAGYQPVVGVDCIILSAVSNATMSEAERHIFNVRMLEGRRAKAWRGELGKPVPKGYLRRPSGAVALDPDQQAQATIRQVFALFHQAQLRANRAEHLGPVRSGTALLSGLVVS
jgi:hypothetical protein